MLPELDDITRIIIGGRNVTRVRFGGDTVWETTYGYVYTIENPQIEYSTGNNYLSARGYANYDDYVRVTVDIRRTYGDESVVVIRGVVANVVSTSESWLTATLLRGKYVATAASRGTVAGAARTANITSVSVINQQIEGHTINATLSGLSLQVSQEANVSTAGRTEVLPSVVTFKNSSDVYSITTNGYTSNSKCPACGSEEDDSYAVITAYAWIIGGTRQYYSWTSGAEDTYVDTTTRVAVAATRFRFTIVDWEGTNPNRYSWIEPSSWIEPDNDQWEDEAGNFFSNRQRKALFDNMGDVASNGRSVKIIVEALKADGTAYPIASGEDNTITLYQAANVITGTSYINPVGTFSLGNWQESGTDVAVAEGEDEPVDTAVLTTNISVTKRETYSSGATKDSTAYPSFHDNTLRLIIPASSSWVSQSENSSDRNKKRNVHVATNGNTTARTGYPSLFVMFPGQTAVSMGTIAIRQAAYDDGGDEPEPED